MKPLKIYLGDLTYNTIVVSTESLPINIGFIASYCIKQFGDQVDITLFKYIDDLEKAISEAPPDILGLSNYCWCQNVSQEMFKLFTEKNPNGLRVWGGPNFPIDSPSQKKFFKKFVNFDIYVPIDGEVGFSNIVHFSKYLFWKKYGYCISKSTLDYRLKTLNLKIEDLF